MSLIQHEIWTSFTFYVQNIVEDCRKHSLQFKQIIPLLGIILEGSVLGKENKNKNRQPTTETALCNVWFLNLENVRG